MTANNANTVTEYKKLAVKKGERGVATLVMVLVLGGVVVELALAGILLVTLLTNENLGIQLSIRALAAAQSGISEGLLRIVRNKDIGSPSSLISFDTGSATANVRICQGYTGGTLNECATGVQPAPIYEIISVGAALTRKRTLVAVAEVDDVTGLVTVISLNEK